ncbi:hypothetical protein JCM6882_003076 [Rhodosporidiobolus microsporus]
MLTLHPLLAPSLVPIPRPRRRSAPRAPTKSMNDQLLSCWKWLLGRPVSSVIHSTEYPLQPAAPDLVSQVAPEPNTSLPTSSGRKKGDSRSVGLGLPITLTIKATHRRVAFAGLEPSFDEVQSPSFDSSCSSDDEDLLATPPTSPSTPSTAPSSPSSSLNATAAPFVPAKPIERSLSFEDKLTTLEGYLASAAQSGYLPTSTSISTARAHGLAFIETEERYELNYDARRWTVQTSERAKAMQHIVRGGEDALNGWVDSDDLRRERFRWRLDRHLDDYLQHGAATPATHPSRFRQGPPRPRAQTLWSPDVSSASRLSTVTLPTTDDDLLPSTSPSPSLVDLPSLRAQLCLPPPLPLHERRERAVFIRCTGAFNEEFPLRSVLVEMHYAAHGRDDGSFFGRLAEEKDKTRGRKRRVHFCDQIAEEEEDDDEVVVEDADPLGFAAVAFPPFSFSAPSTTATTTATWADLDDEDEDAYFSAPPSFADAA